MDKIVTGVYDESCMYPLPGEKKEDFMKRLAKLREKRRATMTEKDKRIAKLIATNKLTEEERKSLIIEKK